MKTELTEIRNRLYDRMPSGDISAWELLQVVKLHLNELDEFIDKMDTQCVLSNVVGRSEQLLFSPDDIERIVNEKSMFNGKQFRKMFEK